ncbi:hypothetical protein [Caldinitratiruptor microaerophilus]|uniref:HEAT repeat protein n=1 Tax=Caldinitratiruptor microaerophilus TaxID=671077 RepID=A0AA35CPS9_9FIRM|nr:hypothetical protein [Caldinitratiruptor microaerophilus]BDG61615.1 hypothetical protein caldi_27050 [Caldinitratiruptor microaerophilus]
MDIRARDLDESLHRAALAAGREGPDAEPAAAERDEDLYRRWALDTAAAGTEPAPAEAVRALDDPDLAALLIESARERGGAPARLVVEEAHRRLAAPDTAGAALAQALAAELLQGDTASEDESGGVPPEARAVIDLLAGRGGAAAATALLALLVHDLPAVRREAGIALGRSGAAAADALIRALRRTEDPDLRVTLAEALAHAPRGPGVAAALRSAWEALPPGSRWPLAGALGAYGDPEFAPLLRAEAAAASGRRAWARCRIALFQMGQPAGTAAPPALAREDPEWAADLAAGARELLGAGLEAQAADWVQEGLEALSRQERADPGAVDWYAREQLLELDDRLSGRGTGPRLTRYRDYTYGALHYYGALRAGEVRQVLALAGLTPPPEEELWPALEADPRLRVFPGRVCALSGVERVDLILEHREETGLAPALVSLRTMALAARGLAHLAWTAQEEEAADRLLGLLPEALAQPERIARLQMAMRGAEDALTAFRQWLEEAIHQGLAMGDTLKQAMVDLWNHTARWELFGHSPWAAGEILSLGRAQAGEDEPGSAPPGPRRLRARLRRRR